MSRALLITGATGKQGGSVIRALLAANADFDILAVTRDSSSPSARKLVEKSPRISLVQGNLNDAEGIFDTAKAASKVPIWGVFSVQTPAMNKTGPIIEERQGKALVDAAINHGVQHFVYSSVDRSGAKSFENATNIPHFKSKHNIEHHLVQKSKEAALGWTILRPVAFMENFDGGFLGKVFATSWRLVVKSRPLQLIATADIGAFAAKAFMSPREFNGKAISLAGDELTYEQMATLYSKKIQSGVPATWALLARLVLWLSEEMSTMFTFFEKEGYGANIKELREEHPELMTLETWLDKSSFPKKDA
ncbi:NmrA domain-containing protein [Fusarium keratoplasticum]|uniref:NmrA domain-containing protein n=1 Tax=Fusarium keratoplasticum TaxID=1328300 RepID=A0ACC0QMQ7_9HYPO|nr:NmrA domain-containing protein [Fusarium keratoplasticum]KAI8658038.1 NmrA domain-containing protein [Fusarium keratoplasticum]KAI8659004.1 NmrA domain-containing protein [Fusarium keratoplasticum]